MLFLDLAPPTLKKKSGIFLYSTHPHLHFDSLPPKSRRYVVSIYDLGCVTSITKIVVLVWPGAATADRGLSRPTSVFRTTIDVCKILSISVEIWQYEGQKTVLSKNRTAKHIGS